MDILSNESQQMSSIGFASLYGSKGKAWGCIPLDFVVTELHSYKFTLNKSNSHTTSLED
jgi:hypothetical protein